LIASAASMWRAKTRSAMIAGVAASDVPGHPARRRASFTIMSLTTLQISVSGMTCGNCVRMVERRLASTPGVAKAQVDLAAARATVEFDPARVSADDLAASIEKLGYQVKQ